jgi:hypothetical protein
MTKDEALDLALETLESIQAAYPCETVGKRITAIKQARALDKKAENARELGLDYEPDEWMTGCPECGIDSGCDCDSGTWNPPAQPAPVQEPVAWMYEDMMGLVGVRVQKEKPIVVRPVTPLCLCTPPAAQRQWVGLSHEEVMDSWDEIRDGDWAPDFYAVIEAKLKERNV